MMLFEELGLENEILDAVKEMNFVVPTPIQEKVIPILLDSDGSDIIALAQTGTGKTAAFGLPLIQNAKLNAKHVQYLVLAPTRELCIQISDDLTSYAKYKPEVKVVPIFGGASIERQIHLIKRGVQIISATPGRLVDLINRGIVDLSHVEVIVLDEADEMLNMGFRDELETILKELPDEKRTLLFSATMPNEVRSIANKYMHAPVEITVGKKNAGAENVNHICYMVHAKDRYLALKRIVDFHPEVYGIIFCRTRKETQEVADWLIKDGYNADSLHGDLSQVQRDNVMNKFRIKHLQLLVATDVAARGLDVDDLTHIINYNLPEELEIYTHRSGRTGRAGKSGTSIVIANMKEKNKLQHIEKKINKKFAFMDVPIGKEVCEKQLFYLIDRMEKVEVDYTQIDPYLPDIFRKLDWLGREELIKKFVSLEFNRFLDYYKNTPDLNVPLEPRKSGKKKGDVVGFTRFFINLGRTDNLKPNSLMGLINDYTGIGDIEIGEIELLKNFSFFEADSDFTDTILKSFSGKEYKNRKISVEISQSKGRSSEGKNDRSKFKKEFDSGRRFGGDRKSGDRKSGDRRRSDRDRKFGGERNFEEKKIGGGKKFDGDKKKFRDDFKDKRFGDKSDFGSKKSRGEGESKNDRNKPPFKRRKKK